MSFNLDAERERFDMNEVVYSLNMEDVFSVIQDSFTEEEQEQILKHLSPDTISRKLDIDWYTEVECLLRFRYLELPKIS